jgi:hypothetical protein
MLEVRAIHKPGYGTAAANLAIQLPVIEASFPEIKGCHLGTINLELPYPIIFVHFDHRTEPIRWHKNLSERFDLVRVSVEAAPDHPPAPAWIYVPHGSPHRSNLLTHELIAKTLPTKPGNQLRLRIDRDWVECPYAPFVGWKFVV